MKNDVQQLRSNGPGLVMSQLEVAIFYFVSNLLIIFNSSIVDKAWALVDVFPQRASSGPVLYQKRDLFMSIYDVKVYIDALLLPIPQFYYDYADAFRTIHKKFRESSKSFYASSFFLPSSVRQDFLALYAFCSCTDDLVDDKTVQIGASNPVKMIIEWLDLVYNITENQVGNGLKKLETIHTFLRQKVPEKDQAAFLLFCNLAQRLPRYPLDQLLQGYQWDLERFTSVIHEVDYEKLKGKALIKNQEELIQYCRYVAGSIGEMLVLIYFSHFPDTNLSTSSFFPLFTDQSFDESRLIILQKANDTGVALQLINIARDIREDAEQLGRVYIPIEWFHQEKKILSTILKMDSSCFVEPSPLHLSHLLNTPMANATECLNNFPYATYTARLLELANHYHRKSIDGIDRLPKSCQAATRIAVKVYQQIGVEVFKRDMANISKGERFLSNGYRVRVSTWDRIWIALKQMYKL